jgi:hypothetical protein
MDSIDLEIGKSYLLQNAASEQWERLSYHGTFVKCDAFGCEAFLRFDHHDIRADLFTRYFLKVKCD